jgi:hypothetical protein
MDEVYLIDPERVTRLRMTREKAEEYCRNHKGWAWHFASTWIIEPDPDGVSALARLMRKNAEHSIRWPKTEQREECDMNDWQKLQPAKEATHGR